MPLTESHAAGPCEPPLRDNTLGELLAWAAETTPDRIALIAGVPDPAARRQWTYAQLSAESLRTARALRTRFEPGERVAVWAPNLHEWVMMAPPRAGQQRCAHRAPDGHTGRRGVADDDAAVEAFEPGLVLELFGNYRGNAMIGVPTMLVAMMEHPAFAATDLSSAQAICSGRALVPEALVRRFEQQLGAPFTIVFGQTECSLVASMTPPTTAWPTSRERSAGRCRTPKSRSSTRPPARRCRSGRSANTAPAATT